MKGQKQSDSYSFQLKKKYADHSFILIYDIGLKWYKCYFFNPYFVQMN